MIIYCKYIKGSATSALKLYKNGLIFKGAGQLKTSQHHGKGTSYLRNNSQPFLEVLTLKRQFPFSLSLSINIYFTFFEQSLLTSKRNLVMTLVEAGVVPKIFCVFSLKTIKDQSGIIQ